MTAFVNGNRSRVTLKTEHQNTFLICKSVTIYNFRRHVIELALKKGGIWLMNRCEKRGCQEKHLIRLLTIYGKRLASLLAQASSFYT